MKARSQHLDRSRSNAKNKLSKLRYWQGTHLAGWSLLGIRPADLIDWRRMVLDEDGAEDGTVCGPDAECGPQTVIHRLNVLSQLYKRWSLDHDILITNPVAEGVRPSLPGGRDRRLAEDEEDRLLDAADKSSRPWLRHAIAIAIETCMRQAELSGLTWRRTRLDGEFPYVDLPKNKNERPRWVPLSIRAVEAIQSLKTMGWARWTRTPACCRRKRRGVSPTPSRRSPATTPFPICATTRSWPSPAICARKC